MDTVVTEDSIVSQDMNHQYLTASDLNSFFHFGCELKIWKSFHEGHLPQNNHRPSPISLAHFNRGNKWEALLVKRLEEQNLILRYSKNIPLQSQIEKDPRDHFYVINSSFKDENLLRKEFLARETIPYKFGTLKPDFIEIWKIIKNGKTIFEYHIIDAKASKSVQVSHQAQVYFYWRALQELLPSDIFVASTTASIWLLNEDAPQQFSPLMLKPQMDSFLFSTVPQIIRLPARKVPWHYNVLCKNCSWREACCQRTEEEGTVSLIPNLGIEEATFLKEVIRLGDGHTTDCVTDIEELDSLVSGGLRKVEQMYPTTAARFRNLMGVKRGEIGSSPIIEAIKSKKRQFIGKPVFHFPPDENYAIVVSTVLDHSSLSSHPCLVAFDISVFHDGVLNNDLSTMGDNDFIPCLARTITSISSSDPTASVQLYCFSSEEIMVINQLIVHESLASDSEDARICIGAIVDMPLVLLTTIQPELLENSLHLSLTKSSRQPLEERLKDIRLDTSDTLNSLQDRLRGVKITDSPGLRRLPKIIPLHRSISELVALPEPGYTNLQQCVNHLLGQRSVPSDNRLCVSARKEREKVPLMLRERGNTMYHVVQSLRNDLKENYQGNLSRILLNEAHPLRPAYIQRCSDENLRKLIFMYEYETLLSLKELWLERVDSSRPAPIVEFKEFVQDTPWHAYFALLEGSIDTETSADFKLFEWILCRLGADDMPEVLFDDLAFFNSVFPIKMNRWSTQPQSVLGNMAVAQPLKFDPSPNKPIITLQLYHSPMFKILPGQKFRLLRRFVDFNTPKIIQNFLEMDIGSRQEKNLFLRLIESPSQVGRTATENQSDNFKEETRIYQLYQQLRDLGNQDVNQLVFQQSQRRAMQSILKQQVTIIHGPPGSGKTHTLALSVLCLLEILYLNSKNNVVVWMTAVTNAAIDMFATKFEFLRERIKRIPHLRNDWLDDLSVLRLKSGSNPGLPKNRLTVAVGTVWQLWNWNEKEGGMPDVLLIDEAGQMSVGIAALAIRFLKNDGRLIVAGDHLQLAPILKGTYPKSDCALFGSILHCLLRDTSALNPTTKISESSPSEILFQLEENFRMNPQLCNFVELIYQKRFSPMQTRKEIADLGYCIADHLESVAQSNIRQFLEGMSSVMQFGTSNSMRPPISAIDLKIPMATTLFLMNLVPKSNQFSPSELHIKLESKLVAHLVRELSSAFKNETIFVVTPHRMQRSFVTEELFSLGISPRGQNSPSVALTPRIWVDTTERLQGSEADIVVCVFSHTHMPSLRRDLEFLYNRPRLNVAISRAKSISIVISSEGVLNPPVEALVEKDNLEGFAYLKAYEDRAWSYDQNLESLPSSQEYYPPGSRLRAD